MEGVGVDGIAPARVYLPKKEGLPWVGFKSIEFADRKEVVG